MNRSAAVIASLALPLSAFSAETLLVDAGAEWSYLDDGTNQGTAWQSPAFDDATWQLGDAELGYGDGDEATVVGFGGNSNLKHVTTYFRHDFEVTDATPFVGLRAEVLHDDGAIVYLNGTEIARANMPAGSINYLTFASSTVGGSAEDAFNSYAATAATLVSGTNTLAVEIHQRSRTSSDISFNMRLIGLDTAEVIRGPYLQKATPTSLVVRWRTAAPVIGVVRYGSGAILDQTAQDASPLINHEIEITGLTPATTYTYSIGTPDGPEEGGTADYTFTTAPEYGTRTPTRIWVIGDSGTANQNPYRVYQAYQNLTAGAHTDVWLMLGDNAYNSGTDSEYQAAVFNMYVDLLRKTSLWSTLGNHDGYTAVSATQTGPYYDIFSLPTTAQYQGVSSGTEAYYSFDHANIHFICLDSYETNTSPTGPMMTWLTNDLAATTQDWIIAFWHHPPYSKGSHDSDTEGLLIDMRTRALPILEAAGVDLVLCGHSHSYERSFQLNGHYGSSNEINSDPSLVLDGGSGDPAIDGAYVRPVPGHAPNEGAVYVVAGSSGLTSGGTLDHEAMYTSQNRLGSLILEVDGRTLDATFIDHTGVTHDAFRIDKPCTVDLNGDGIADSTDLLHFLADWFALDADFNGDGTTDVTDLLAFLVDWFAAC